MDLRSGRSYWLETCGRAPRARAPRDRAGVDVLVVGAGITGAFVAHRLTRAGATVALVDRRRPGAGSTAASTALLMYELDTPLLELAERLGDANADAAYRASHGTLASMRRICDAIGVDVELRPRRSLQLAQPDAKPRDLERLRAEARRRQSIGIGVRALTSEQLKARFGFERPGALLSEDALEVNPLKLTFALIEDARERGAWLLPRRAMDLRCLARAARPFRLALPDGSRLVAHSAVVATGYETPEIFPEIAALTELRSSYAVTTTPLREAPWPERALLWETGDPYFYARTTPDGRVMAGGEDEPFTSARARDRLLTAKSETVLRKLRALLPGRPLRRAYRWAGTFAQTSDGLPYIGPHERWPQVHFALGYGGNGITFGLLAGEILTGALTGAPLDGAPLFGFDRLKQARPSLAQRSE